MCSMGVLFGGVIGEQVEKDILMGYQLSPHHVQSLSTPIMVNAKEMIYLGN